MKAYVVCLSNDRYLPGLYAIALGLRKTGAAYPLVVLVPEPEKQLADWLVEKGYTVRTAPAVKVEGLSQDFYWNHTFFKLAAASMTEYEKIVLLDSDMLILENLDCLFEFPHLSATVNGKVTYSWKRGLSSGVLVLVPSGDYFASLLEIAPKLVKEYAETGRFAGDQDVFNASCPDWYERKELHFHERFNECIVSVKDFRRFFPEERLAVVHFAGPIKTWEWSLIHFIGVWVIKYLIRADFVGAYYLFLYYRLTRHKGRKKNPMSSSLLS